MHRRQLLSVSAGLLSAAVLHPAMASSTRSEEVAASRAVLWMDGDPGQRLHLRGRIVAADGRPVPGAAIRIWQADGTGVYQAERYRAQLQSGRDGSYNLITVLPGQYSGHKHIHVAVQHADYWSVNTQMLFRGDSDHGDATQYVALEEARLADQTVLLGRFDLVLQAS